MSLISKSNYPQVAVVIFAAGMSKRMGSNNKLLLDIGQNGIPMIRRVVEQAIASDIGDVYVVIGYQDQLIKSALSGLSPMFISNDDYCLGMSASLRVSICKLGMKYDGLLFALGDMPNVTSEYYKMLFELFLENDCERVTIPSYKGKIGNPVLWPKKYFKELALVNGDKGGRELLRSIKKELVELVIGNNDMFRDIDNYEQLEFYQKGI